VRKVETGIDHNHILHDWHAADREGIAEGGEAHRGQRCGIAEGVPPADQALGRHRCPTERKIRRYPEAKSRQRHIRRRASYAQSCRPAGLAETICAEIHIGEVRERLGPERAGARRLSVARCAG